MAKHITFEPPFRVGRKQRRAILDANGIEVGLFSTGHEQTAQEYCDYLNKKWIEEETKKVFENIKPRKIVGYRGCITHGSKKLDDFIHCGNNECAGCNMMHTALENYVKEELGSDDKSSTTKAKED